MAKKQYKDEEGSMSKNELETLERSAKIVKSKIKKPDQQLPAWIQSKITKATDQINAVSNYMQGTSVDEDVNMSNLNINKDAHIKANKQSKIYNITKNNPNPNEVNVAKNKLRPSAAVSLPKVKEEITLVDKILSEMGHCNKTDRGSHCPTHGNTKCPGSKKKKTVKEHCGCEGDAVKDLEKKLKKTRKTSYESIDKLMRGVMKKYDMTAQQLHDSFVGVHKKTPDEWIKELNEVVTVEDAFGNPYVEFVDLIKPDPIQEAKKGPCWKGYTQVGMKMKGGREVPNCVPSKGVPKAKGYKKKSVEESVRIPASTGNVLAVILSWKGKIYTIKMFFPQAKMPSRKDVIYEIQKIYPGCVLRQYKVSTVGNGEPLIQVSNSKSKNYLLNNQTIGEDVDLNEDWQSINRKDRTDGLSQKAVNAYRKENPGSKLKTAVTEKNPKGSRKNRRSNFCSRMKGMKSKLTSSKTARDPDSRINKALRRWRCR